ncbi:MAG: hypothetical protein LBR06_06890 [Bacteroidales bacterium]|nr:hypothetical protein [Bacteroidales bacterium]
MRHAIIDLGTNTCNMLVAETDGSRYNILFQGTEAVKLGRESIGRNELSEGAFRRAADALQRHRHTLDRIGGADSVVALATSAVRDAVNRTEFIDFLLRETGFHITCISGQEEAQLIFRGVQLAFGSISGSALILDIGGGSHEFIHTVNNVPVWKESFPLGVARVLARFPLSDPVTPAEISAIEDWFAAGLQPLWDGMSGKTVERLIGCSGAFDTIVDLLDDVPPRDFYPPFRKIEPADFEHIASLIISSTGAQRQQMRGMLPLRIEMIVPAILFIKFIMRRLDIPYIVQTAYSMREGVLYSALHP